MNSRTLGFTLKPGGEAWAVRGGTLVREVRGVDRTVELIGYRHEPLPFAQVDAVGKSTRSVELDATGRPVPITVIARRGRLAVGRGLLAARKRALDAGEREPALNAIEVECLAEALLAAAAAN